MAENEKQEQFDQPVPRYKFQTNILKGVKDQTTKIPYLDKVSASNEVPIYNLLISLGGILIPVIFITYFIVSNTVRAGYFWFTLLSISIGIVLIVLAFLVPTINSTMLWTSVNYITFFFTEKIRRKSKTHGRIRTFGLQDYMDGVIELDDGRVGIAYTVEGHLSNSSLPTIASLAQQSRLGYFITREPTTEEHLITAIREVDVRSNEKEFLKIRTKNNNNSAKGNYIKHLADTHYKYVHEGVSKGDYTVKQVLLIIDDDLGKLQKANDIFMRAVNGRQLYAHAELITSPQLLSEYFSPLLLTSKRGVTKDVQHIQERYKKQQADKGLA